MTLSIFDKKSMEKNSLLKQKQQSTHLLQGAVEKDEVVDLLEPVQIFRLLMTKVQVKNADNVYMKGMDLNVHLPKFTSIVIIVQNSYQVEMIHHFINIASYAQQTSVIYIFHLVQEPVQNLI